MTEWIHETVSFSRCRGRRLQVDFSGGSSSSNGGSLLLREVDRRLGLTAAVARALGDRRQRGKVRHKVEPMVRQRVHAVVLGYEDLNDHNGLREDWSGLVDMDEHLAQHRGRDYDGLASLLEGLEQVVDSSFGVRDLFVGRGVERCPCI